MKNPVLLVLSIAGLLACGGAALAESPTILNETYLPGYVIPHAHDIVVDEAGSVFMIAAAYDDDYSLDILVVKIDPNGDEVWTIYVDGGAHDYATDLALDSAGDVWVTGWTSSQNFPTVNGMDDSHTSGRDVFLMKVASTDGSILYSTLIGGDYTDSAHGIAINSADEIYLTGVSGSTNFPTTPDAYQPGPSFPEYFYQDAFIMKLSASGDQILYSTYFGGTHDDWSDRIALDGDDNIIIVGGTDADDFPLVGAYDTNLNDIFVSKLSADGSTLLFSTFLGGSDLEYLRDMTADALGNVYLTGTTRSTDFPTTAGAYLETFVGGIADCGGGGFGNPIRNCEDFFVSKLSTSGAGLIWSTFLGGTSVEEPRAVTYDAAGNAYVAGYTSSDDFPLGNIDFGAEIVVCKLSDDGGTLDFTHSVDSGSANRGNGIALDDAGAVYFSGTVGVPASLYVCKLQQRYQAAAVDDQVDASLAVLQLERNYPNPFNPATTITYAIPEDAGIDRVNLSIFDVSGRLVRQLVDQAQAPGSYSVTWHGRNEQGLQVGAGVYYYRLDRGTERLTRSMVMLK